MLEKIMKGIVVAAWIAVVPAVLYGCGGADAPKAQPPVAAEAPVGASPSAAPSAAKGKAAAPKPKAVQVKNGEWTVPEEVKPGTYTATGKGLLGCYWERLRDFDHSADSLITNGYLKEGEHGRMVIKASDAGISFTGDCVWTRVK